jgi:integrase
MKKAGRPLDSVRVGKRALSKESLAAFIKAVERKKKLRDEVMFKLCLWLGLRVQEICNIKLSDIKQTEESIYIHGIKNGRERTYCFEDMAQFRLWKKVAKLAGNGLTYKTGQIYLFPSPQDITKPLTTQSVKMLFKRYALKAGLGVNRSIHDLRHTVGTMMAEKGYNAIQISRWLRHKNIKSTQRYFEEARFGKDDKQMAEDFGEFM